MTETKKNIFTLFIAVGLSLVVAESFLRLFEKENFAMLTITNKDNFTVHKPNLDFYNFDNENGKKVHIKTNNLGFVGGEFNKTKNPNTLRIAILGDSFTAATQIDYELTYPYLLKQKIVDVIKIATTTPYSNVEVMNFGVGGKGTADEMKYYSQYVQGYHPDIVIISFYLGNDISDNSLYYGDKDVLLSGKDAWDTIPLTVIGKRDTFLELKDKVYRSSAIVRLFDRVIRGNPYINNIAVKLKLYRSPVKSEHGLGIPFQHYYYLDPLDSERDMYVQFTTDLLNNFHKVVTDDGAQFFLMFIPEGMTVNKQLVESFTADHQKLQEYNFNPKKVEERLIKSMNPSMNVINLREIMEKKIAEGYVMYNKGIHHFSEDGSLVVAEYLAKFILSKQPHGR